MYKIILTGGGTGGHVIPNIALIDELKKKDFNIEYIGSNSGMEKRIVTEAGIPYHSTTTVKFSRSNMLGNMKIPYLLPKGISEAKQLLKEIKPDVVFAKGGFVSLPSAYAAKSLNIPLVIHESDTTLGLANKLMSSFAKLLITTDNGIKAKCKTVTIGNPVRDKIFRGVPLLATEGMHYDPDKPFLLVVGGSSGAKTINDVITDNIDRLTAKYNVLHITGEYDKNITSTGYKRIKYANNIEDYYAAADLVISRCGANAMQELLALKKKVLFIPLSENASRGDQIINAKRATEAGYAISLNEEHLTGDTLLESLDNLSKTDLKVYTYNRDIPKLIVNEIIDVIENNHKQYNK